jgi:hypothetical protein
MIGYCGYAHGKMRINKASTVVDVVGLENKS